MAKKRESNFKKNGVTTTKRTQKRPSRESGRSRRWSWPRHLNSGIAVFA